MKDTAKVLSFEGDPTSFDFSRVFPNFRLKDAKISPPYLCYFDKKSCNVFVVHKGSRSQSVADSVISISECIITNKQKKNILDE